MLCRIVEKYKIKIVWGGVLLNRSCNVEKRKKEKKNRMVAGQWHHGAEIVALLSHEFVWKGWLGCRDAGIVALIYFRGFWASWP